MLLIVNLLRGGHDWCQYARWHARNQERLRTREEKFKLFWSTSGRQSEGLHSIAQPLEIATGEFPAENGS